MSENIEKALSMAKRVIELRDELSDKSVELDKLENEIGDIVRELDSNELKSEIDEVRILREIKETERFDTPTFKKENSNIYEEYRFPQKRFDQKKLKEDKRELYNKYLIKDTVESITIERYITKNSLPSL